MFSIIMTRAVARVQGLVVMKTNNQWRWSLVQWWRKTQEQHVLLIYPNLEIYLLYLIKHRRAIIPTN